ncbi:MAG: hypothetical protein IKZ19_03175 [Clostridia bacterium]|nr:hypothetical protein [Clostridia bacterium]
MKAALVLMAAGLGRRYGGCKQLDGVGPNGEILMEYAVHDAVNAGFSVLVFIIKEDMRRWMEDFCAARLGWDIEIRYAVQSMEDAPYGRVKPYGTVHALLCAECCTDMPFTVINADDYYGPDAFRKAMAGLEAINGRENKCIAVPYLLKNTLSPNGTVARALFESSDGRLESVREIRRIGILPDGTVADTSTGEILDPEVPVSMNMWGFGPGIFDLFREEFSEFMAATDNGRKDEELPIPVAVNSLMKKGRLEIGLLPTDGAWFGVTYREDRAAVAEKLVQLHAEGLYPQKLNGKI